ncbi:(3S,6E)-nerolidol synthase 2, chloroplastic/mitochondrial [Sesamum angolense]|uniref:(3S,6E)-nerolidol synthase 2, chloroplastic/mitochondrial n=1 Tax=Sesamum angolense TaxID=2727404 RepID=A0AAE1WUV7_9LAMI|nr:(3S,6E)-nerolidol synthase 2, chloroplastic/mitochondrial [Sesamum angolense]
MQETFWREYEEKMEEVGQLLLQSKEEENENPMDSLVFVDAIQRVGVDHHFEEEIEMVLGQQYNRCAKSVCFHGLHDVSLFFRLLRQQGYCVSAAITNTLTHPQHKTIPRLSSAKCGDHLLKGSKEWKKSLRELVNMDFLIAKSLHREELLQISKWDHSAIDMLPNYMRMSYKALLHTTNQIANNIQNMHGHNPIDYMKATDELQDGRDGSYIDYYMKDEPKLSVKQARQHVLDMITNEWKNVNEECFRLRHYSSATCFKRASLNLARMVALTYGYDENQRLPLLEEYVKTALYI